MRYIEYFELRALQRLDTMVVSIIRNLKRTICTPRINFLIKNQILESVATLGSREKEGRAILEAKLKAYRINGAACVLCSCCDLSW